jgi:hypothetical protein
MVVEWEEERVLQRREVGLARPLKGSLFLDFAIELPAHARFPVMANALQGLFTSRWRQIVMRLLTFVTRLLIALISHYKLALPFCNALPRSSLTSSPDRECPKWECCEPNMGAGVLGEDDDAEKQKTHHSTICCD